MRQESNHRMNSGEKDSLKISNSRAMGVIVLIALLFLFQVVTFVVQKVRMRQVAEEVRSGEPGAGGEEVAGGEAWAPEGEVAGRSGVAVPGTGGPEEIASGSGNSTPARKQAFPFNPNTITRDSLQLLGFSQRQAASIIKYRTKGGKFRVKRDFAKMYVVDSAKYALLEPFILLPDSLPGRKSASGGASVGKGVTSSEKKETSSAAERGIVTNKPKNVTNGEKNVRIVTETADSVTNEVRNAPIVTETQENVTAARLKAAERLKTAEWLKTAPQQSSPQQSSPPQTAESHSIPVSKYGTRLPKEKYVCNLNTADSAALVELYGIGGYYARKILQYRERLGGSFVDVRQLLEIEGFTQERLDMISGNVVVMRDDVKKVSLLEADMEFLRRHPYIGPYAAKGIETFLRLKGRENFSSEVQLLDALVKERVLSVQNADKLREYLLHL